MMFTVTSSPGLLSARCLARQPLGDRYHPARGDGLALWAGDTKDAEGRNAECDAQMHQPRIVGHECCTLSDQGRGIGEAQRTDKVSRMLGPIERPREI